MLDTAADNDTSLNNSLPQKSGIQVFFFTHIVTAVADKYIKIFPIRNILTGCRLRPMCFYICEKCFTLDPPFSDIHKFPLKCN